MYILNYMYFIYGHKMEVLYKRKVTFVGSKKAIQTEMCI